MGAILDIVSNQSLFQTTTAYSILFLFLHFSEKFQNLSSPLQPIPVKILKECSKYVCNIAFLNPDWDQCLHSALLLHSANP